MVFGPWIEIWSWLKTYGPQSLLPKEWPWKRVQKGKFQFHFITWHYLYLVSLTILGSVLIYPTSDIRYIDALLFASGASTQSGLNPVDVNNLNLSQQVIIMILTCIATPIFIHGSLVFLRLYWFEKRFQNIVRDARSMRHNTRTRSMAKSEARRSMDEERATQQGVAGREIRVLRQTGVHMENKPRSDTTDDSNGTLGNGAEQEKLRDDSKALAVEIPKPESTKEKIADGTGETPADEEFTTPNSVPSPTPAEPLTFHRDIMFADEVTQPTLPADMAISPVDRLPPRRSPEQHIAFVENQRNPKQSGTLRIPGPRDFDRGQLPRVLNDDEEATRNISAVASPTAERHFQRRDSNQADEEAVDDDVDDDERETRLHRLRAGLAHLHLGKAVSTATQEGERTPGLRQRAKTYASLATARSQEAEPMPYLSWAPTIGRNSAFVDLSEEQREELGGIEYRALKTLALVIVLYYAGFHVFGMVCFLPWIKGDSGRAKMLEDNAIDPGWWGVFTPASHFNDLGFTLTADSMISFQTAVFPLLIGAFLIVIGNTGFPCMLRFTIWLATKCVPYGSALWEELCFLLDHPRRCFTLLFPSDATWWLFWVLVVLNGIDLIFFIILDINDETVESLSPGIRVLDGWFQAASTRTAGFSVVNLAELHPAVQVSYLIMMYISIFPIAISVRRTNVYEEKSLGIYPTEDENEEEDNSHGRGYVGYHLRRQLSFDLWFVFLCFFFIAIIEGTRLGSTKDVAFSLFAVLFEVVSAYGTVGLSLGYPGTNASLTAQFKTLSKLIIIALQIRGRHRGLPYALDRAILLPSEGLQKKEETADHMRRMRRNSILSLQDGHQATQHRPTTGASSAVNFSSPPASRGADVYAVRSNSEDFADGGHGPGPGQGILHRQSTSGSRDAAAAADDSRSPKTPWLRHMNSGFSTLVSGALSAGPTFGKGKQV